MGTTTLPAAEPHALFRTDGEISRPDSGWTYEAGAGTNTVSLPFDGHYPDKGGRFQSPEFPLERSGTAYHRLTFSAQAGEPGYWWLDYADAQGRALPDCNSALYPGSAWRDYDQAVYVPGAARRARVAFVSKGRVRARAVRFAAATAAEAARWCDTLYATLPPLAFRAPPDAMAGLPKTAAALASGAPWRVVMLGDSIVNDSFNSLFQALLQRDFPAARCDFIASVRGSTGCLFYQDPPAFDDYVAAQKPDLLMIGGISHFIAFDQAETDALAAVIRRARERAGCEVLVMSQPLSSDWRRNASGTKDWRLLREQPAFRRTLDVRPARDAARQAGAAFWDLTAPCHDYLAAAGACDFSRDSVHNNDRGKQIIGRVLRQFFLRAVLVGAAPRAATHRKG